MIGTGVCFGHAKYLDDKQDSKPITFKDIVEAVNKINPVGGVLAKIVEVYEKAKTINMLRKFQDQSLERMTSYSTDGATKASAAEDYLWAQKELFKLGASTAVSAVGLANSLISKAGASEPEGMEKAITTGFEKGEEQVQEIVKPKDE